MSLQKLKYLGLACAFAVPFTASAQEGAPPFEVYNRLRVEFDDNVSTSSTNEQESLKIIEEVEFLTEFNLNNTFVGLRYNPSFTYYDDREEDDTDLHHQFDAVVDHEFSPRLSINAKETFRLAELPELIDDGVISRQNNDYIYNSVNLGLNGKLTEKLSTLLNGRYTIIRYDDTAAQSADYDKLTFGANLGVQAGPKTTVGAEARYSTIEYDSSNRDSESVQVGASIQTLLGPELKADVRAGFETRDFEAANTDSADSPYASGQLTYSPNRDTAVILGGSFSLAESSFVPYVNQERTMFFGSITRSVTAKIDVKATAVVAISDYAAEETVIGSEDVADGDETTLSMGLVASYQLNRSNWVELGYKYNELDSDVRSNDGYSRSRVHVGWKTKI